jgi:hypothetical protein
LDGAPACARRGVVLSLRQGALVQDTTRTRRPPKSRAIRQMAPCTGVGILCARRLPVARVFQGTLTVSRRQVECTRGE